MPDDGDLTSPEVHGGPYEAISRVMASRFRRVLGGRPTKSAASTGLLLATSRPHWRSLLAQSCSSSLWTTLSACHRGLLQGIRLIKCG